MKKWILGMVLVCFTALIMAGCSQQQGSSGSGKTRIRFLMPDNAAYPYKDDWLVVQQFREKFPNLEIEMLNIPSSDYSQKYQMMLNSGDTPDIISYLWANQVTEFASAGVLTAIDDHLDKLPNYSKRVAEWNLESEINDWRELDGKLYVLPGISKELQQPVNLAIRKDLLKKYDIPIPETYEDFYKALKIMKQNDPSILGLTEREKTGGALFSVISRSFDTNGGFSMGNGYAYKRDEGKWVFTPSTEEFRSMLRYLNRLYVEDLLDDEAFSQDTALFNNKIKSTGKGVAAAIWNGEQESVNTELASNGVIDADFDVILPPAGPNGTRLTKSANRLGGGFVLPIDASKRPGFNDILSLLDFMYSDQGTLLNTFGVEDITYNLTNGTMVVKPEIKTAINTAGTLELAKDFGVTVSAFRVCPNYDYPSVFSSPKIDAFNKELSEGGYIPLDEPSVKFNEDEKNKEKIIATDLKSYYGSMMIKFILGDVDIDADWDSYINEMKSKGSDELMQLVDVAWTRSTQNR